MLHLPVSLWEEFINGNHVMRHQNGVWNDIWSDMYIESTVMGYRHAPGGLKGIELNERCQACWPLSHHVCSKMV